MTEATRKALPGDKRRMTAAMHNAIVDVARLSKQQRFSGGRAPQRDTFDARVLVRNVSGAAVDRFGVLAVDGVAIEPAANAAEFQNHPIIEGVEPDEDHRDFVILQEPLAVGAIGRSVAIGVTPAHVLVDDEESTAAFADVSLEGETAHLVLASVGPAKVLWRESGAGMKWALIAIGAGSSLVFPVALEQDGGTNGDASGPATLTYTVTGLDGGELGTTVSPVASPHKWRRPAVGYMAAATSGLAYLGDAGELVLTWINEVAEQEAC